MLAPASKLALPWTPPDRIYDGTEDLNGQYLPPSLAKRRRGLRSPRPADFANALTSIKKTGHFLMEQELL